MKRTELLTVFAIGAVGYPLIEVFYRKRTHWSMAVAGGVCFTCLYRIHQIKRGFARRCVRGAAAITLVEF